MIQAWTEDRIAELTRLYLEGKTAREVAITMGGVTRNSVIGKVFRLQLKRSSEFDRPKAVPRVRRPRQVDHHKTVARIVRSNGNSNVMRVLRSVETERYQLRCIEIVPLNLTFDQLGPNDCRYIYGDTPAQFVYCGHPRDESSYCPGHHALCWRASSPPRHRAYREAA